MKQHIDTFLGWAEGALAWVVFRIIQLPHRLRNQP